MKYTLEFNYSTTLTEEPQCSEKHNNIDLKKLQITMCETALIFNIFTLWTVIAPGIQ